MSQSGANPIKYDRFPYSAIVDRPQIKWQPRRHVAHDGGALRHITLRQEVWLATGSEIVDAFRAQAK